MRLSGNNIPGDDARCPVCHKKMEMIGKGEDSTFVCSCGHKERLSNFRKEEKQKEEAYRKRCSRLSEKTEKGNGGAVK